MANQPPPPEDYSPSIYSQPSVSYSRTGTIRATTMDSMDTVSLVSRTDSRSSLDTVVPTQTQYTEEFDLSNEKDVLKQHQSAQGDATTTKTPLLEHAAPIAGQFQYPPGYHINSSASSFRRTADVPDSGLTLPRFYFRGAISIAIPLVLVFYYYLTYWRWLRFPEGSPEVWQRTGYLDSVSIVNYSWFVLGTFALNLGTFAVAGSVASMVMRKRWAPKNFRRLLILSESTFEDPAGWASALIKLIHKRKLYKRNGLLWDILAFFSIIGFVAWPLTGLTMQTQDGFSIAHHLGNTGATALVVGRNMTSINGRDGFLATQRATEFWSAGYSPQMPLRKQFYITPGSKIQLNTSSSNDLPDDASESIFLAPQADGPLIGEAFGLAIRYSCNVVNSTSQFTVLNRRNRTLNLAPVTRGTPTSGYVLPGGDVIFLRNKTSIGGFIQNVNASLELASDIGISNLTDPSDSENIGYATIFSAYPGIDHVVTLEAALWQSIEPIESYGLVGVNRDNFIFKSAENDIPELRNEPLYPGQTAIGVRCQASSAIGTAMINGVTGEYTNFTQLNANPRNGGGIKRFETGIPHMLLQTAYIPLTLQLSDTADQWLNSLYSSIEKSSLTTNAFGDFLGAQPSVIQAEDLRTAMLRAHKTWAVHIMYDGLTQPTYEWKLGNVTIGYKAMVLTRGVVPAEIILAMLTIWALSIIVLAASYQFRRRWKETLDGYTIFRFGVDRPDDVLPEMLAGEVDKAAVLERLPGMVGDLEPTKEVGYIGLVRGGQEANWNKRYG
ncbi:hypothetical protein H072_8158 [Dactylellina haptotyla CBS 200.50]|uniref:Uncharacterized protein n=1 Tax=Dactylellina haptotyla (strain CBS 200.50) TaxID=1284197 RepID=S8A5M2_DACHA|nr:hypothetical protein H072_8158 [Dactylellina haptotyla CBS 200.50]